ncbi:MAG: TetR/AcrR family transcriptional regulator, partial [Sulfurimonas sp.]|nr:TetR/AcrR family transcriptional regulator [Sulfurimonas sp.]
ATGTLFHHFKTKEDLVHELYALIFDSLISYHKQYFQEEVSVYEKLQQIWHLNIEWGMANTEYANFLEHYAFHYYASASAVQDASKRFDYYTNIFQEVILNNLVKIDSFEYILEHFSWNMRMNGNYFIAHPEQYNSEMVEKTFQIYWSGISNNQTIGVSL